MEEIVPELDLDGVEARKTHRREYTCPGPNKVWHAESYNNRKPFGFPIHGCIVGYKQKSTLAVSRVLTTHLTTLLRLIWMLLESTEDAPLNYIPTWAQKIELWLVYTLF